MSSVVISGDTSGAITLAAPAVAGTNTITLPATTGTLSLYSAPQITTYTSSSGTYTVPTGAKYLVVEMIGNVRAGFKSDIKSYAIDNGRKACNLYRLGYPSDTENNICYELDSCQSSLETALWNEYIATPMKILNVRKV